jgi:excinuclease ABC subunit A
VIKTADWILDLGPEGGDGGGEIVVAGTPEDVVKAARPVDRSPQGEGRSYTGQFLKPVLARGGPKKKRVEAAK